MSNQSFINIVNLYWDIKSNTFFFPDNQRPKPKKKEITTRSHVGLESHKRLVLLRHT